MATDVDIASSVTVSVASSTFAGRARNVASAAAVSVAVAAGVKATARTDASVGIEVSSSATASKRTPAPGSAQAVTVSAASHVGKRTPVYAFANVSVTANASINQGREVLGVCEVIRAIFLVWGIERPCSAPKEHLTDALNILNSAMQMVWNHANDRDYWTQSTETITLTAGTNSQTLPNSIQNVVGPGRIESSRRTIVPIGTAGDFENFADYFNNGEAMGQPSAYFIERQRQNAEDPVRAVFMVTPTPTVDTTFLLDVVKEPPYYQVRDATNCPVVPIPHKYVESLLLPVCRYLATRSFLYVERTSGQTKQIETEYFLAREGMDLADPLPGKSGGNINRREEQKT